MFFLFYAFYFFHMEKHILPSSNNNTIPSEESPIYPNNVQHEEDKEMQLGGILQGSFALCRAQNSSGFWIQFWIQADRYKWSYGEMTL